MREVRATFPLPPTPEEIKAGAKPSIYAPREVFARSLSAEDAVTWLLDAQASGMGGMLTPQGRGGSIQTSGRVGLDLMKRIMKECRVQGADGKWIEVRAPGGFDAAFEDLRFLFDVFGWLVDFNFAGFSGGQAQARAPTAPEQGPPTG